LQDDRDDLFAQLTQEQQANKNMNQELINVQTNLAIVKDELEFAKRAVKTLQSSKATSKEAMCADHHLICTPPRIHLSAQSDLLTPSSPTFTGISRASCALYSASNH
jgi:hypothetical protein